MSKTRAQTFVEHFHKLSPEDKNSDRLFSSILVDDWHAKLVGATIRISSVELAFVFQEDSSKLRISRIRNLGANKVQPFTNIVYLNYL